MSHRSSSTSTASIAPAESTQSEGPALRTLEDVRNHAALEVAMRAIGSRKTVDGVRMGVSLVLAKADDFDFLKRVAEHIRTELLLVHDFVFALATSGTPIGPNKSNTLMICGSPEHYVQRALLLASAKLIGRVVHSENEGHIWLASIKRISPSGLTAPSTDEVALWDVLHKAARPPMDPLSRPTGSHSAATRLALARAKLERLSPRKAFGELSMPSGSEHLHAPTLLVDIRPQAERERDGMIQSALFIERNDLEWRFDPQSDERLEIADRYDLRIIVIDGEGRASSLAAVALHEIGLLNATDVVGGYRAWIEAGLPVDIARFEEGLEEDLRSEPSVIRILN
ncbi:Rhodanese domain-containing protein [Mycena chlorophos]|uniref:Rhodanese domain-containing protein n=1 Tax=Mycena chlorophos TaxID=658473 RepID=A0A8H6SXC2_MYCCL|nr:Rhodanese domain-containing protein [Mycena chlorophos]